MSFLLLIGLALADSPLTSTQLFAGYPEERLVQEALKTGTMDDRLAKQLSDPRLDHGVRVAALHALGWEFKGKDNASRYLAWLERRHRKVPAQELFVGVGLTPEEKLVLGFLLAMDDYFQPGRALPLVQAAEAELRPSRAVSSAVALVVAQSRMETSWCEVWTTWEAVGARTDLREDLAAPSVQNLQDYLQLYQQDCPVEPAPEEGVEGGPTPTPLVPGLPR